MTKKVWNLDEMYKLRTIVKIFQKAVAEADKLEHPFFSDSGCEVETDICRKCGKEEIFDNPDFFYESSHYCHDCVHEIVEKYDSRISYDNVFRAANNLKMLTREEINDAINK